MQVTTARKAVTLLLSYLIFTKPLTEQHGTGLLLIAMGIVLKLLPDNNKASTRATTSSAITKSGKSSFKEEETGLHDEEDEEKRPLV